MWVKAIAEHLQDMKTKPLGTPSKLPQKDIVQLCQTVRKIFLDQPTLIELEPPLTICGDVHGQFHDLMRIFDQFKYPWENNYLFLGDYVDRGCQSIETICLLFAYKIMYPENFFMLRGNHECTYINRDFGFYEECVQHYNVSVWRLFCEVFNCMPLAATVGDKIFCVHGGISPSIQSLDDIRSVQRPLEVPEEGVVCDLLWSDPEPEVEQWEESDRGTSYIFGAKPLRRFLRKFGFDLVVRAHQAVMGGYDFPFPDEEGIVTVFSAPNYCYTYKNKGAVMHVEEDLTCSFSLLPPLESHEDYFVGPRPGTPPRGLEN